MSDNKTWWEYQQDNEWEKGKVKEEKEQICLHDMCKQCHGTGVKQDGTICVHHISCPCPKCTIRC
jgi:hypothetical protein